jgi:hypothetical protein
MKVKGMPTFFASTIVTCPLITPSSRILRIRLKTDEADMPVSSAI